MRNNGFLVAICVLIWLTSSACTSPKAEDFTSLDNKLNGWVDSGYYEGCAIVLFQQKRLLFRKFYGDYNEHTIEYIASAGKWLASATIAAVVEEGTLSWNDPVKKWLPEFKDSKGEATLLQLLSHTAGYPSYQPADTHVDNYQTLMESVRHIVNLPADTIPGAKFLYGGLAMQVAGRMAELATGKDWEVIFQDKIAKPLGMTQTHFVPVDSIGDGHSPMLGGGARSSLADYAKFLEMIYHEGRFNGKKILKKESVLLLEKDQIGNAEVSSEDYFIKRGKNQRDIYGLGLWREEIDQQGHATIVTSPSWAGAYPWIDRKEHIYGFFLAHVNPKTIFNAFYASPILPYLVRDIVNE